MAITEMILQLSGTVIIGICAVFGILFRLLAKKKVPEIVTDTDNFDSNEPETKEVNKTKTIIYSIISFISILTVGLVFVFAFGFDDVVYTLKRVLLVAILFVAAYYDNLEYRIPNKLILCGLGCRAVLLIFEFIFYRDAVIGNLISEGIAVAALVILSVVGLLIIRNGIGMGDIKLFILMALCQGISGVMSSIFTTLICAFFYSVFLILTKKKSRKDFIAFAPCILIGTFISVIIFGA
ncbi:MAG: prepilin peptidase [Clostridia bacterium]|nr:prepilin peptidase [Clostridia bacterium]